ncbi:MAG: hypothetical protein J0M04_11535 [Verrucomicrobia bacterium]|nr:hypothetical protein [Verrucomicrobiota bacterium]
MDELDVLQEMDPAHEAKLFQRGCLGVFLLLITLGALACFVDRAFLFGVGGVVAFWAAVCIVHSRKEKARLMVAFRAAFTDLDYPEPILKTGSSYGYPTFTITFATEDDMKTAQADGLLGIFKRSISELYGHCGSESNPFDASRAVWATYIGWEADFKESLQRDPSGNSWIAEKNQGATSRAGGNGKQAR